MSTSLATLRQLMSERIGDWRSEVTSANGAVNNLVCANLADAKTNFFQDHYALIANTSINGQFRKINTFTSASGSAVPYINFTQAINADTLFEMHRYKPDLYIQCINRAAKDLYSEIRAEHEDEWSLITNNILPNALPAAWAVSTTPDKWTVTGLT